jgi:hypothetical protein
MFTSSRVTEDAVAQREEASEQYALTAGSIAHLTAPLAFSPRLAHSRCGTQADHSRTDGLWRVDRVTNLSVRND